MGSSKGKLYSALHPKLDGAIAEEWKGLDGTKEKKFFPQLMGVKTFDELYEWFTPGPHQDKWSEIKWTENKSFVNKKIHARAISYMDAWRRDLVSLYEEDEINSLSNQKNRAGRWLNLAEEIEAFLKPKE